MKRPARGVIAAVVALGVVAGCTIKTGESTTSSTTGFEDVPSGCVVVDLTLSPEKIDLFSALARQFNAQKQKVDGKCIFVRPQKMSSGGAELALEKGWDPNTDGPNPVVWSPSASVWGAVLNQRLSDAGEKPIATKAEPFMLTPLVIAMPQPMAKALGYPETPVGWSDILNLARNQEGWGAYGHPEWGPFRLGKTNPNFSTSGLNSLIAGAYAATGKTSGLSSEDLDKPDVIDFAEGVESAVVHYGDTTLTFLNNWYRADQRGTSLTYVSAVAIEEKSIIDYNTGNPDGILQPGEKPRKPKVPLVAIYPKEGTLFSDNPYIVLDAPWVSATEAKAARVFEQFIKEPANQKQVLTYGFRPGNPAVATGAPITAANGLDPNQPQTLLTVPDPPVATKLLDRWQDQRKRAKVMLVLDVSGSMGDPAGDDQGDTKLDLAKQAAIDAIDQFGSDDEVGLRIFSTELGDAGDQEFLDLVDYGRIGDIGEKIKSTIRGLVPTNGTPLYDVIQSSYDKASDAYDPSRINAVVLLTDGMNDDGNTSDDGRQLDKLITSLRSGTEGENSKPIRVFTIGYGADADLDVLRRIAEASNAAVYDASDPTTIGKVLTAVVSNF
jgi:Ca-activated chloride channel family protein